MRPRLIFEGLATGILCAAATVGTAPVLGIAALWAAFLYMSGPLTGGYYNPALTLALWMRRRLSGSAALIYVGVQLAAALVAILLMAAVTERNPDRAKDTIEALSQNTFNGWTATGVVEFFGTFLLVMVLLMVTTSRQTAGNSYYGIAIAAVILGYTQTFAEFSPMLNPVLDFANLIQGPISSLFAEGEVTKGFLSELTLMAKLTPRVLYDVATQFAGAACAAWVFRRMFPEEI